MTIEEEIQEIKEKAIMWKSLLAGREIDKAIVIGMLTRLIKTCGGNTYEHLKITRDLMYKISIHRDSQLPN